MYSLTTFNTVSVPFCVCACAFEGLSMFVCMCVCVCLFVCLFACLL